MKKLFFIGILLFSMACSEKVEVPKSFVIDFFENYEKQGLETAVSTIVKTNKYMMGESGDTIVNFKEKFTTATQTAGKYHSYEIISEYSLGESIKHYTCILNYDRQPLRLIFTFYKADNSWSLYGLNFDNDLINELDDMAKYHYY